MTNAWNPNVLKRLDFGKALLLNGQRRVALLADVVFALVIAIQAVANRPEYLLQADHHKKENLLEQRHNNDAHRSVFRNFEIDARFVFIERGLRARHV